ncbi:MAG: hypothetical protein H0T91_07120 [Propionibacteriaceae bacterium]|nr:hypothetical protein [Propionibacteriaceae bacterium]
MTIEAPARVEQGGKKRVPTTAHTALVEPAALPSPPRIPGRRNPKWIALGITALCLGALLSYFIYARVADESAVVAVVATVHRGGTVRASDLTTVKVSSGSGVPMVPASELNQLVGRKAVYDLVAGSLLPIGAVADVVVPSTGRAVVGIRLVSGRAPAGLLPPGSPVRLIAIPPAGAEPGFTDDYTGDTVIARVVSQAEAADGTSTIVNVDVPARQAPSVALLASQERLALVRDADK